MWLVFLGFFFSAGVSIISWSSSAGGNSIFIGASDFTIYSLLDNPPNTKREPCWQAQQEQNQHDLT